MAKKVNAPVPATPYAEWIQKLKDAQGGRPGYKDQTEESLATLVEICRTHNPDRVVEIGTSYGASTRCWLEAGAPSVTCIDITFSPLQKSEQFLPLDWPRLHLVNQGVQSVNLAGLVQGCKRPLVFFDCHGADNMRYVLKQVAALPGLCFVVDDMWYSSEILNGENVAAFRKFTIEPDIDTSLPQSLWPMSYAAYHGGGSFYSFDEVLPLLEHVNGRNIDLQHSSKTAWWSQA